MNGIGFRLKYTLKVRPKELPNTGPPPLTKLKLKDNQVTTTRGRIDRGKELPLSWAQKSFCWPATQNNFYNGKHVLYQVSMPPHSTLDVTALPGQSDDISLYGYQAAAKGRVVLPPNGAGNTCEASALYVDRAKGEKKKYNATKNPGKQEKIRFTAIRNPYTAIVGVVGSNGAKTGSFQLKFDLKVKGDDVPNTGPPPLEKLSLSSRGGSTSGKIDRGKVIPLGWASTSGTACWPATQNEFYNGHHVLYAVKHPRQTKMEIELVPAPGVDLSLYAYQVGNSARTPPLPPDGAGAPCEASAMFVDRSKGERKKYGAKHNPGKMEKVKLTAIRNEYTVVIGVVGAHKVKKGSFKLNVKLEER